MKAVKKRIVVDVWQLNHNEDVPEWAKEENDLLFYHFGDGRWRIPTSEGMMFAFDGDYLIKGAHGELYPCKEEIFDDTYEIVEGEDT